VAEDEAAQTATTSSSAGSLFMMCLATHDEMGGVDGWGGEEEAPVAPVG